MGIKMGMLIVLIITIIKSLLDLLKMYQST